MESTILQKEVDLKELNHSDTQMLTINSLLQKLQFKIQSINQGLNVTESLNEYITQIEHRNYGEITDSNYYCFKTPTNNQKITFNNEEWGKLETFLISASNANINMSFKKNELDRSLYNNIFDNLKILLDNPNELSELLLGFNSDTNIQLIQNVVCGTLGELIKTSLEKETPIIEIIIRLRLGENIFSSISSLNIKNIGKELKNYLNLKCNRNIKDLVENISILNENLITYPYLTHEHVTMILLDNLRLTLNNISECPKNYIFLQEYHKYFRLNTTSGIFLQDVQNLHLKLRCYQNPLFGQLGSCIIDQFIKAKIMKKNTKVVKKKKLNILTINYTDLTIFYNRNFPRISNHNRNSKIEIRKSTDHHVFIKKIQSHYRHSSDGRGVIDKPNYITNTLTRSLFTININFLIEFLELLHETLLMPIETLLTSQCNLLFLTELFNLNFISYQKSMLPEDFRALLSNCLDFAAVNPLHEKKDYKRMYYKLNNKIIGFKIYFIELLYQITIMHRFSFFYFDWFADYRLRVNYSGSVLNLSIPLARVFMQYYARFDGNSIELEKVKKILKEQIKSLSLSKTLKIIEKPTLKNCLLQQNYKLRESFFYRHLQNDLQNCHEHNYLYNSMISYDSTSSGTQMMGLLIRSKSVASLGLLVKDKDQKDVYESFLDYNREICNNITTWFESYFNEIPKLKPFLEQTRIKINKLQESHYVELYQQKRWPAVNNKKFIDNFNEEFVNFCNNILSETPYINTLIEELEKEILEHMYSKIFWLESFSKHIFKHPKKIYNRLLKAFVILIEMFGYIDDFNSPNIQDVYIRQLVKQMLMTSIYGATAYGRYQQLMNSYFKITVAKGLNVSDSVFMQVSNFFTYLNPILIYWIENQHPRLLLLTKAISKIKYLKDIPTVTLQNDTSMFCFEPKKVYHTDIRKTQKLLDITYIITI
jgi:hypothetical protein